MTQEEINKLVSDNKTLNGRLEKAKEVFKDYKAQLDSAKAEITQLKSTNTEKEAMIRDLLDEKQSLSERCENMLVNAEKTSKDINTTAQELTDAKMTITELTKVNKELQTLLDTLSETNTFLETEVESLRSDIQDLTDEIKSQDIKIIDLDNTCTSYEKTIESLKLENEKLSADNKTINAQNASLVTENEELKTSNTRLHDETEYFTEITTNIQKILEKPRVQVQKHTDYPGVHDFNITI